MSEEVRLIDANQLKKEFNVSFGGVSHAVIAGQIIDDAPTVDPYLHGYWIECETSAFSGFDKNHEPRYVTKRYYRCSKCMKGSVQKTDFCAHCGTKMDLNAEEMLIE